MDRSRESRHVYRQVTLILCPAAVLPLNPRWVKPVEFPVLGRSPGVQNRPYHRQSFAEAWWSLL